MGFQKPQPQTRRREHEQRGHTNLADRLRAVCCVVLSQSRIELSIQLVIEIAIEMAFEICPKSKSSNRA